jgi:hypothetical protein
MNDYNEPMACTLSTRDAAGQVVEWTDLRDHWIAIEKLEGGTAMTFPVDMADTVEHLAARETECCRFLSMTTTRSGDEMRLEITSDIREAQAVIAALVGRAGE